MINGLKLKIKQKCDIRNNLKIRLDLIRGDIKPDCYYTCKWAEKYKNLSKVELDLERFIVLIRLNDITKEINVMGKAVLILRGGKWSI